jgi:hypothetical protein
MTQIAIPRDNATDMTTLLRSFRLPSTPHPKTASYVALAAALSAACGGSDGDSSDFVPQSSATSTGVMQTDNGVATAPARPGASEQDVGNFVPVSDEDANNAGTPAAQMVGECGATSYTAEPKTLEMYVLFDDSGSWSNENWTVVKDAVKGFVTDDASDGIGVALSFFGSVCSPDAFITPQVGMNVLPANRAELQQALDAKDKNGETVTQPALQGGIDFARDRLASGVNSRIVMLLVTDGRPDESDCNGVPEMPNDIPAVAMTAAEGFDNPVSIPTYVLAVAGGDDLTERLHSIAIAGGTNQAINADPATLTELFSDIRNQELAELPCEYDMPAAYAATHDPDLVNVTFSANTLTRVADENECQAATAGGWYYDNPTDPTRIIVCSTTCDSFKAATANQTVDIALGCPTQELSAPK